ncbi:hypothetical protein DITRI_Ditri20bG0084200 [Diplodiscus trichospermus]
MAISTVHQASTSISQCTYHVFLSFKGVDTRKNFTDHLYTALVQVGIHTFRDDEKIERGKNTKDEILKAILHESKMSIIVFSKDYASSRRCLSELVKILEHRKSSQYIVLPVFYDVDPSQVKKQTGSYAEAFARHEGSIKSEMNVVQRWRDALKEVADLGGMVLRDRYESQFIQDIVKHVHNTLQSNALYLPPYLVGIDSPVTRINWWLEENKVRIITICGIGGIGKTTIAKIVFNQNIQRYEGYSFLADVRERSEEGYGNLCKVFEVKELAYNESLQLFNWYAFGKGSITESFMEYSSKIVKHCSGLPLALKVLGSSLSNRSMSVWKSALEKLEAILDSKIQKILSISYNSLQDDHDKNLFLDIACFFVGKDRDYTTTILDGCDFYTTVGIDNLIGRSLLFANEKNKLMMHQMVRDMGREIIRQESSDPGERSRFWDREAFDGSETIKCLAVDMQGLLEHKSRRTTTSLPFAKHSKNGFMKSNEVYTESEAFAKMRRLKLLQLDYIKLNGDFKDFPKGLVWLRWHGFSQQSLPMKFDIKKLVVLDIRNNNLKRVWKGTKWLSNLKILNLSHSHGLLKTPIFTGLPSLEKLMLKDCIKLIEVDQSIGELKKLTFLSLKTCKNLMKLPRKIGLLLSLEVLILSNCSRLGDIPWELHNIKSLRVLNLDETSVHQSKSWISFPPLKRSKELSFFWAFLPCNLVKLSLESCKLSDDIMPSDLGSLPLLKCLNLSRNPLCSLPESIKSLTKLDELRLTSCTKLQVIPKLPILSDFAEIYLSTSPVTIMLTNLPRLFYSKQCIIFGCERLTEVQEVFQLEPIENIEAKELKSLFNMESIYGNIQVQLYNSLTDTKIIDIPQVILIC